LEDPAQTLPLPLIVPGVAGIEAEEVTARLRTVEEPQALFAVTVIFPLVAPAVGLIEFVVELPVQPPGNVHV
jgi:hypothetical protein